MEFEWDEAKRRLNVQKHKLDFVDVQDAFDDPLRQVRLDGKHDYGEARFSMLAWSPGLGRIVSVAFTWRSDDLIRIISARNANRRERRSYG